MNLKVSVNPGGCLSLLLVKQLIQVLGGCRTVSHIHLAPKGWGKDFEGNAVSCFAYLRRN